MVQDSTYFQNELRQKLNSINEEVNRMNGELETTQKENANINQFEKKYKKV
jgi:TolA-binding protein